MRAAFDSYGVPYTYMGDKELAHMSNLKAQYDIVVYPHTGANAQATLAGEQIAQSERGKYRFSICKIPESERSSAARGSAPAPPGDR